MTNSEDTTDVVELVIRYDTGDGYRYLLGRRISNEFWEFVGGKMKVDEPIEDAAFRELQEEIRADWNLDDVEIVKKDSSYDSPQNPVYTLYPILLEIPGEVAESLSDTNLSEHDKLAWVTADEVSEYETFGAEIAMEDLGLL